MGDLTCDGCGHHAGRHDTYQDWEDAARARGWFTGEDLVLCPQCR